MDVAHFGHYMDLCVKTTQVLLAQEEDDLQIAIQEFNL
jgi:hypothetical protein